jgi:hypothetical protein
LDRPSSANQRYDTSSATQGANRVTGSRAAPPAPGGCSRMLPGSGVSPVSCSPPREGRVISSPDPCQGTPWTPASAGMIRPRQAKSHALSTHRAGKLCFARATHQGVERGAAPLRFLLPPRVGGTGLKRAMEQPALDSRFRGNDPSEAHQKPRAIHSSRGQALLRSRHTSGRGEGRSPSPSLAIPHRGQGDRKGVRISPCLFPIKVLQ